MNFKEALECGKPVRRKSSSNKEFGTLVEKEDGRVVLQTSSGEQVISLLAALNSNDWETKKEARTFWVGLKIYRHIHYGTGVETDHKFMIAVEGEKAPEAPTDDGKPWAKVVEILDESQE